MTTIKEVREWLEQFPNLLKIYSDVQEIIMDTEDMESDAYIIATNIGASFVSSYEEVHQ